MGNNLQVYTPDSIFDYDYEWPTKLFLAGSIENGKATDWQQEVIKSFKDYDISIYNPRRSKWNPELEQSFKCQVFNDQVVWEQKHLENCNYVLMNLLGDTMSPISLLELGQLSFMTKKGTVVVCPDEFWRRGNVEVVCVLYKIPLYKTLDEGIAHLKTLIKKN